MHPYLVLGVPLDADDPTIRRAYLDAIKLAPPDLDPERFQAVNTAYEQIKNEASRHEYILFRRTSPGDSPLDVFVRHIQVERRRRDLPFETMKSLLRECSKT